MTKATKKHSPKKVLQISVVIPVSDMGSVIGHLARLGVTKLFFRRTSPKEVDPVGPWTRIGLVKRSR